MSSAASPSLVADDLVDDSVSSSHDIVADRGLTPIAAAGGKKALSKDKERALAEEAVDKVKAGAEERDEDNSEDSQLSLAANHSSRAKRAPSSSSASTEEVEAELAAYLQQADDSAIFADLSVRFEDTRAEADQTFILLGDALLLQLLNDRLLQWSPPWRGAGGTVLGCGGQFLHAVFAFEMELTRMCEGGRQCRVLWLDELGAAVAGLRPDFSVLRRVLRLHVRSQCRLMQDDFPNWWSPEFGAFLERVDPAFLIVGDGHDDAYTSHSLDTQRGEGETETGEAPLSPSSLMRSLTLFLLARNFRCIRLSELSCTANAMLAFQFQMAIEYQHQLRTKPRIPQHRARNGAHGDEQKEGRSERAVQTWTEVVKAVQALPCFTSSPPPSRLALTCYALAQALARPQDGENVEAVVSYSKALLLHAVLLSSLPLSARHREDAELARRLEPQSPPLTFAPFLSRFFTSLDDALLAVGDGAAQADTEGQPLCDASMIDLFDLRLLLTIHDQLSHTQMRALGLTRAQAAVLDSCWSLVQTTAQSLMDSGLVLPALSTGGFLPLFSVESLAPQVDVETAEEEDERRQRTHTERDAAEPVNGLPNVSKPSPAEAATPAAPVAPKREVESWEDEAEEVEAATPAAPTAKRPPSAVKKSGSAGPVAAGQWDDEDAEGEAALDDWEAMAEEPVKRSKTNSATGSSARLPSAESFPDLSSALLPPVAVIRQPLLDSLCHTVNSDLASVGSLQDKQPPPLPPSPLASADFDARFLGEEIKEEGDILRDKKAMRQHQRQINFMTKYSRSLGGGKIVQREVIVKEKRKDGEGEKENSNATAAAKVGSLGGKGGGKAGGAGGKKGGGGGAGKGKGGVSIAEQIKAEGLARQKAKEVDKVSRSIAFAAALRDLPARIESLDAASEAYSDEVVIPALLQLLEWQLQWWKEQKAEQSITAMTEAVRVWTTIQDVYRRFKAHLRVEHLHALQRGLILLGFDDIAGRMVADYLATSGAAAVGGEKEVSLDVRSVKGAKDYAVGMSAARFQMEHGGPFMLRNVNSSPDDRVDFYPDAWQARLLDVVDARHSALLVAPTSSGKTFISYYAMKQTLKENAAVQRTKDRRQIVYVAPNKALVNQVSGDIYRRFGDVFGVLTTDWQYRVLTCDVLITVPTSLESLLLDPERAEWVAGIRYVIFDEVHLIGSEDGLLWERCIQICQHAPFLALSATVGNAEAFADWLARCQVYHQRPLHLILHTQRWADLEKYAYIPQPEHPLISQCASRFQLSDLHSYSSALRSQASLQSVCPVHPCSAINRSDLEEQLSLPPELAFSPQNSLSLFDAMKAQVEGEAKSATAAQPQPSATSCSSQLSPALLTSLASLEPDRHFSSCLTITKTDAMDYEKAIKGELSTWLRAGHTELVHRVVASLSGQLHARLTALHALFPSPDDAYDVAFQLRHFLPLLVELSASDQLPAIVFCHDQLLCNQLVIRVVEELERLQDERRREERTDESERARLKEREKAAKAMRRLRDKQKNRAAEEELQREGAAPSSAAVEEEDDVYDVDVRFSFLKQGEAMDPTEMEWWISRMLWKTGWKRSHPLVRCLYRGVGVHHGALVKPYRDAVETLFRAKHLKVVVATQTLALGINMPARAVVFCGDSKLLTPLQYRQMAGRAGRRGFDNVGHVVFFAIPPRKMLRLLKSPLLSLRGQYPIHTSFTLRTLLFSQGVAASSPNLPLSLFPSLVQSSFFAHSFPSPHLSAQVAAHYRLCCDDLFQRGCLTSAGKARGLAGFIAHLHSAEPANFLLAQLLLDGTLAQLTARFGQDKNGVARDLLFLLAHLFIRVPMPPYVVEMRRRQQLRQGGQDVSRQSTAGAALRDRSLLASSTVTAPPSSALAGSASSFYLLDPLPPFLQQKVDQHNDSTLQWATRYLQTFVTLYLDRPTAAAAAAQPLASAADGEKRRVVESNGGAPGGPPIVNSSAGGAEGGSGAAASSAPSPPLAASSEGRKRDGKAGAKKGQRQTTATAATASSAAASEPTAGASAGAGASSSSTSASSSSLPSSASSSSASFLSVPPMPDLSQPPPSDPALPPVFADRWTLPRSGLRFPHRLHAESSSLTHALLQHPSPTAAPHAAPASSSPSPSPIRSPFVALSGWSEAFLSSRELARSLRCGVQLEATALPVLEWTDRSDAPLPFNSFLLDFLRHGDLDLLIEENGIARAKVFELLKRFDLILAQLVRALSLLPLPTSSPLLRAFQHLQQSYHELFAKQALQH